MVGHQLPKLMTRVQIPVTAPSFPKARKRKKKVQHYFWLCSYYGSYSLHHGSSSKLFSIRAVPKLRLIGASQLQLLQHLRYTPTPACRAENLPTMQDADSCGSAVLPRMRPETALLELACGWQGAFLVNDSCRQNR